MWPWSWKRHVKSFNNLAHCIRRNIRFVRIIITHGLVHNASLLRNSPHSHLFLRVYVRIPRRHWNAPSHRSKLHWRKNPHLRDTYHDRVRLFRFLGFFDAIVHDLRQTFRLLISPGDISVLRPTIKFLASGVDTVVRLPWLRQSRPPTIQYPLRESVHDRVDTNCSAIDRVKLQPFTAGAKCNLFAWDGNLDDL